MSRYVFFYSSRAESIAMLDDDARLLLPPQQPNYDGAGSEADWIAVSVFSVCCVYIYFTLTNIDIDTII